MGEVLAFLGARPLLGAALSFTIGIAISPAFGAQYRAIALAIAVGVAGLAVACSRPATGLATLLCFASFLAAGAGSAALRARVQGAPTSEVEWKIEGTVFDGPVPGNGRQHFIIDVDRVEGHAAPVHFFARLSSELSGLLPGDRVVARARLSPAPRDANPGGAGLEARLRAEGIAAVGTVVERQLAILGPAPVLSSAAQGFRSRYGALAALAIADPASQALTRALAVGDRADLGAEVNDDFSASGLAHILSVSGLHIAVVAAGLYRALRWLLSRSERLLLRCDVRSLAALSALPATWAYVWVTGAEVPAVRSGIMASAIFVAMALRRDADTPSSLAAALLAVLAWDPASLWSVSFQLSFAAVAGLMLLSEPLRRQLPIARPDPAARGPRASLARLAETVVSAATGSLAASLATAPLVAAAFHRASLVAVLSNAVALPVASALTGLAAASAAALPLGDTPAALLLCLADPAARALLYLSHLFATLPFASTLVPAPSTASTVAWYAVLAGLALLPTRRRWALRLLAPGLALLGAAALWRLLAPLFTGSVVVTFLAVGQGDSALVQLPGGEAVLVDGGGDPAGRFDPGERIVVPALAELGATRLRAVVLSHPDHLQGLLAVLQRASVRELWIARGLDPAEPLLERLLAVARARGVAVRELAAGDRVEVGGAAFEVLHPASIVEGDSANDASLVLRLRFQQASFLFAGDIEEAGEQALLSQADPAATVLKAPHHGSRTSSTREFVAAVHPRHVVFDVGRNRFGFPHPEVVARWQAAGAVPWRTDESGAITFRSDGRTIDAEAFLR